MTEHEEKTMEVVMTLIMHGGDARSGSLEAIEAARNNDFERAQSKLDSAAEAIKKAHKIQTDLLDREASGEDIKTTLLLVHAADHVMNATTYHDLGEEMLSLYKRINK